MTRNQRWLAEYRVQTDDKWETRTFVVDYHSDDQFILNAAAWLRNMWGHHGVIVIRHQVLGKDNLWLPTEEYEYTLPPTEPDPSSPYHVEEVDGNSTVLGKQETSRKAALAKYPRSGTQRFRILVTLALHEARGMTREQLERHLNLGGNSVHPRVLELIEGGWVYEGTDTRKTRSGNDAVVLRITSKGMDEVEHRGDKRLRNAA